MAKGRPKKNITGGYVMETEPMEQTEQTITGPDVMYVYLNHPGALIFILPNGKKVTLNGANMANECITRGADNTQNRTPLQIGTYGHTCIKRSDWEAIEAKHKHMKLFRNGYIFAEADKAKGDAKVASFCGEQKHGLDPIDTTSVNTKSKIEDDRTNPA